MARNVEIHYSSQWNLDHIQEREDMINNLAENFFNDHYGGVFGIEVDDDDYATIYCNMDMSDVPQLKNFLDTTEPLQPYVSIEFENRRLLWAGLNVSERWIIYHDIVPNDHVLN
jgi:hypothetical protein